ncbi:DUF4347 domain-containing protein [Thiomicrorhabdus indica]|uniref:DUF4347 domain-containing protein n=1 Tax=Thiomicrorhabdus indica TaxID=2267253 RepID=UPI002AA65A90|nr:DUF4347 domain-containing protein [Thiomicrorhabdus indica]
MSDLTTTSLSSTRQEVAFIDTSVADYQTLVEGLPAGIEVVLIEANQDGIQQIADWAANNSGYDAIHILSHGSDGQVQLGTANLNNDTLASYSNALAQIGQSLTEDGDILLYGCNVAASETGVEFIGKLAQATSADIAASDDLTGAADKGGDWVLEVEAGSIESEILMAINYKGALPERELITDFEGLITENNFGYVVSTNGSVSASNILDTGWNVSAQGDTDSSTLIQLWNDFDFVGDAISFQDNGTSNKLNNISWSLSDGSSFALASLDIRQNELSSFTIIGKRDGDAVASKTFTNSFSGATLSFNDDADFLEIDEFVFTVPVETDFTALMIGKIDTTPFTPPNDVPVLGDTPLDASVTEDVTTAIDLSAYNISDADGDTITLRLAVDRGIVTSTDGNGTTAGITIANSGSTSMTLQGTADALNTYLNDPSKITYTTAANDTTAATLTVTPNDGTEDGTSDTVTINVTPVNDASTYTGTGLNPTFNELDNGEIDWQNLATLFGDNQFDTIEDGQKISELTLTITNVVDTIHEKLKLNLGNESALTISLEDGEQISFPIFSASVSIDENNTATVVIDNADPINLATYFPNFFYANTSENPTAGDRVVTLTTVKDDGGTDNGGQDTTSGLTVSSTVTVVSANDAPILDTTASPSLTTVLEDSAAPTNGSTTNASLVSDLLTGASDPDGDTPLGMAVTGVSSDGTLYYSTDAGANWTALGAVSATSALILSGDANTHVYFKPDANYSGTLEDAITFKAWDGTGGYTNGETGVSLGASIIGSYDVSGSVSDVVVVGDYAYLANSTTGLDVIDISNPANPTKVGNYANAIDYESGVEIGGNYAYVLTDESIDIVSISESSSPQYVTKISIIDASDIQVIGNYLYVGDKTGDTFQIYDVSQPGAPSLKSSVSLNSQDTSLERIFVDGNTAYIAAGTNGLKIVEISPDQTLSLDAVKNTIALGNANDVVVSGNYAYVADSNGNVKVVDLSLGVEAASVAGTLAVGGAPQGLDIDGDTLYLANGFGDVLVIDISSPTSPEVVQTIATADLSIKPDKAGDFLFVANRNEGLQIIDISENTAFSTASDTVSIEVTAINDAPTTNIGTQNRDYVENDAAVTVFASYSSVTSGVGETDTFDGLTLTVSNVSDGTAEVVNIDGTAISLIDATGTTTTSGFDYSVVVSEGTATITLTNGDLSAADMGSLIKAISYEQLSDNPTEGAREITLTSVTDNGGTENGGVDTKTLAAKSTITVSAVNDAPVLDANESPALDSILIGLGAPTNGSTDHSTLVSDLLIGASDAESATLGMAITGVNENGTLYYTTDGGATWTEFTGTASETSALVLTGDANTRLYFAPDENYRGTLDDAITFKAWDGTGGYTNGQTGVSLAGSFVESDSDNWNEGALFVEVLGDFAYVSNAANGELTGYNISDPSNNIQFDGYSLSGGLGLSIANDRAYVTKGSTLSVVDIQNPDEGMYPTLGSINLGFEAGDLTVVADKAYIVDQVGKAVRSVTISDPENISMDDSINYPTVGNSFPNNAEISGTNLFVASPDLGILIYDISTFGTVVTSSSVYYTSQAYAIKVMGDYAYVADGVAGLKVLDISNLGNITEVGSVDTDGTAIMLKVVDNTVYLADSEAGVQIIDVSDPTNPTITQTILPERGEEGSTQDVAYANGTVFIADYGNAFLSYTQTENTAFSTASDTVSLTVNENSLPTGEVQVEGTVQQGQTLTASNTLADEDGLGDISYQWLRDGQAITGVTGETYTLTSADVGAEISVSASYTDGQGTDEIVTSTATSIVSALPTPPPPVPTEAPTPEPTEPPTEAPTEAPTPEPTVDTVDGVTVETQEESDENGNQTTTINVAPTTDERDEDEQTENRDLADIPIASDEQGNPVVQVSIPTGVGFNAQAVTPATNENGDLATTLRELLISASEPRTESEEDLNEIIQEGIDAYVPTVNDEAQVTVRTVTLSTAEGRDGPVPSEPIIVTGAMGTGEDDLDNPDRQEALVIDVRDLPSGTVLQLDNVEFAIVIGATSINGGEGRNIVSGDGSSQFIVLGEADDILKGGAGNDTIGSRGGDDELYGGSGDDILFGGTDDDLIDGGVGTDIAVFAYDYAEYSITHLENTEDGTPQWQVSHATEGTDTLVNIEYLEFADVTITLTGESQINDFATSGLLFF